GDRASGQGVARAAGEELCFPDAALETAAQLREQPLDSRAVDAADLGDDEAAGEQVRTGAARERPLDDRDRLAARGARPPPVRVDGSGEKRLEDARDDDAHALVPDAQVESSRGR